MWHTVTHLISISSNLRKEITRWVWRTHITLHHSTLSITHYSPSLTTLHHSPLSITHIVRTFFAIYSLMECLPGGNFAPWSDDNLNKKIEVSRNMSKFRFRIINMQECDTCICDSYLNMWLWSSWYMILWLIDIQNRHILCIVEKVKGL